MSAPPANRLGRASSPYLLAHAADPIEWHEWGEEPFAEARRRSLPVLLSIGYAACHWCHVMARESFRDPTTADTLNRWFVCIKVDREERPDVDRLYMDAAQILAGTGGWPLTVFLTPDGEPFFAGTYFPREPRFGHPGFTQVLAAVHEAWEARRHEVVAAATDLGRRLAASLPPAERPPGPEAPQAAYRALAADFDPVNGGFGGPPKFPQASSLELLLRAAGADWAPQAAAMAHRTLRSMADGGLHDQLGGGFARYAVDRRWLVPHFEKMLYDNALLARLYARGAQVTGDLSLGEVARTTLEYLRRDLALPGGGLASSEDADSEGEEGRFYTFSYREFCDAAGEAAPLAAVVLGVTPEGSFEGRNVLHRACTPMEAAAATGADVGEVQEAVAAALAALTARRAGRVRPARDDKVVTAWNGLAIRAFAESAAALAEPRYLQAARETAAFALADLRRGDGRLLRSRRDGRGGVPGFCDDYAALALGLFALYRATGEVSWFEVAAGLVADMVRLFRDPDSGAFFATGADAERLIARPVNVADHPTPSDNALAAEALLTLAAYTGEDAPLAQAEGVFRAVGRILERAPAAAAHLASVLLVALAPPRELAVVGPPDDPGTRALLAVAEEAFRPDLFVGHGDGITSGGVALLEGRGTLGSRPAAYLCRRHACAAPTADPAELRRQLGRPSYFTSSGRRVGP